MIIHFPHSCSEQKFRRIIFLFHKYSLQVVHISHTRVTNSYIYICKYVCMFRERRREREREGERQGGGGGGGETPNRMKKSQD